jgi:hypothetical protein
VNHTLAYAEAQRRGAQRAVFAVCGPNGNESLQAGAAVEQYRRLATDTSSVVFIPLERVLERLVEVCLPSDAWAAWAIALRTRYAVPPGEPSRSLARPQVSTPSVTAAQRRVVEWMGTPAFGQLVAAHTLALGHRMTIYFRPNDAGLVRIALHPEARRYVGFRPRSEGKEHIHAPGAPVPTAAELSEVLRGLEAWLPNTSASEEERGVIGWLSRALTNQLILPELGEGWVFLHQEWRFVDGAGGKKADVLAVHLATGQLGIVELKASRPALGQARLQVEEYAELWERSAAELAPFFTDLIRAMGVAYGNELAAQATVHPGPAALFVGVASNPLRVWRHTSRASCDA